MSQTIIQERESELIEEFSVFDDPMDQYEYIIDIGKTLPPMNDNWKTDENMVKGCQSSVWLYAELNDGTIQFHADSNTVITKGIIALLVRVLNQLPPQTVIDANLNFIQKINLDSHLSSQRSNGLQAMIKQMKLYAVAFQSQLSNAN